MGPLGPADSKAALVVPADEAGVLIDGDALDQLVALTGGYPYFVQLYGRHVWDHARGKRITTARVAAAHSSVMAALDVGAYGAGWDRLRPSERRFLVAMAEGAEESVAIEDVVGRLGQSTKTLSPVRQRLLGSRLIEAAGHGRVRFTPADYSAYVRYRSHRHR